MHLVLVRHAQSANNVIEAEHGESPTFFASRAVDPALSPLGEAQAAALGACLGAQLRATAAARGARVRLACSTMRRTMQTAEPLSVALGIRCEVWPDVFEQGGFYDSSSGRAAPRAGPTRADVEARYPAYDASRLPEATAATDKEKGAQAAARAERVADELRALAAADADDARPELLVLVSHCDFIGLLTRALLLGAGAAPSYWDLNNTALVHIALLRARKRGKGGGGAFRARLLCWNRSEHLTDAIRSGIAWKNLPGCEGAAAWARFGDGGSGLASTVGDEAACVAVAARARERESARALAAAAIGFALGVVLASARARRK